MNVSMKKVSSFTLKFYLLLPKELSDRAKIYLRITVDRKKAMYNVAHSL
jgi:hypothetical protein